MGNTTVVVVMPALNEAATIQDVIGRIPRRVVGFQEVKIVVVDDGSTDETAQLARAAGAQVVCHDNNRGVGAAFGTGIDMALRLGADVIVNMDSDGQFDPEGIPALVRPILEEHYGFVTCTRFGDRAFVPKMPWIKKWGNRMMCKLVNRIIWNGKFTDVSCGFRAYARETALRLNLFGSFTYTQETFIDLAAKGIPMTEVPLRVRGTREFGKSRVASNLFRYATRTLPIIIRAMRDVRPLLFFGAFSLLFMMIGFGLWLFIGGWWLSTGRTSPWTSLIVVGGTSFLIGILTGVTALLGDQLGRSRRVEEEILYHQKRRFYDRASNDAGPMSSALRSSRGGECGRRPDDACP